MQNTFDDPWSPVEQRVPAFPAGFVAFAPSPGPNAEFYAKSESASVPPSPESRKSTQSPEEKSFPGRTAKGKEKVNSPRWEHIVVSKGGLHRMSEIPEVDSKRKSGVRNGKLDPKTKEKARRIRKISACWTCWIQKVPCSEGEMCERCRTQCRKQPSLSTQRLCWRSGFKDYAATFFPDFMHAHLRKNKIEDLISEHTTGFLDTVLVVEVSTGSVFKPMRVRTNAFLPKTGDLLRQSSLTPAEADQASQLVQRPSAPIGILGLSLAEMRKKCKNHIEDMISNTQYAAQATAGDMSQLPKQVLEIVCEYSAAKKDVPLLRNALKLHAIHYFMGSLMTFSERSAREIYSLLLPSSPPQSYLSSRLLNRQVKYVMHKLHREITLLVLEDLERSLRSRTPDSWGPSFCAILILCLCIEGLQSAADMMVVCDMREKGVDASYTRDQSYIACEHLDEYPFRQCKKLFHEIYKSHRDGKDAGRKGDKSFNPLKMAAEERRIGLDSTTEGMVRAIFGVVRDSWNEIVSLSERPAMINLGYTVDPNDIKTNNTGRLAAKFLRSFFPE